MNMDDANPLRLVLRASSSNSDRILENAVISP